jgi:hypothetical protein
MVNMKRFGRKPSLRNFKVLSQNSPGRTEDTTTTLSLEIRSQGKI